MQSTRCTGRSIDHSSTVICSACAAPPHFSGLAISLPQGIDCERASMGTHGREGASSLLFLLFLYGCYTTIGLYKSFVFTSSPPRELSFDCVRWRETGPQIFLPTFQLCVDVGAAAEINKPRSHNGSVVAPTRRRVLRAAFNFNISPSAAADLYDSLLWWM